MPLRILVADDDPHIRDIIDFALKKNGHDTVLARNGEEAMRQFRTASPDLIVLDVGMPELDGLDVCRAIRRDSDVPILFLSARDEEIDRILGLEIGGDDYLTKPFSPRELVARIGVIMRRVGRGVAKAEEGARADLSHGGVRLDRKQHSATFAGLPVPLTATEFAIVAALMERPVQVFDREKLLARTHRGHIHVSDRTVDSHIRNIRAKFAAAGCASVIETLHGIGFRLGPCEAGDGASTPGTAT